MNNCSTDTSTYLHPHLFEQLLRISSHGADFYVRAQDATPDAGLRTIFASLAAAKLGFLVSLRGFHLRIVGEERSDHVPELDLIPTTYREILAQLRASDAQACISRLAEIEEQLLAYARILLRETDDPVIREHLEIYITRTKACLENSGGFSNPATMAA